VRELALIRDVVDFGSDQATTRSHGDPSVTFVGSAGS